MVQNPITRTQYIPGNLGIGDGTLLAIALPSTFVKGNRLLAIIATEHNEREN